MDEKLKELISEIDGLNAYNPIKGLPDPIFYFVGRNSPYINVDLLLSDEQGSVLLTWRDDQYTGKGWHIPGGIIRFQEEIDYRINQVAIDEIGVQLAPEKKLVALNEIIDQSRVERSHFISLLYQCFIDQQNMDKLKEKISKNQNEINFFKTKPKNLLKYHEIYTQYFKKN